MAQNPDQRRASDAVASWLAHNERSNTWLKEQANVDLGTVGTFLSGMTWPKTGVQGEIEKALGWPAGTIRHLGRGGSFDPALLDTQPANVGGDDQDAGYVSAPGPHATRGISDDEVLRVLDDMQDQITQLRRRMEGRPPRS